MKRFVIDTNIYSAFKTNHAAVVARLREAEEIVVCPTVHGELLAGFKCGSREICTAGLSLTHLCL